MATPDLGTASAGRAAAAENAATAFGNPAGMARLGDPQLLVGLQGAYGISEFNKGSDTTVSGGNGGNAIGGFPGAGFYYVHSISPDFKLGISTVELSAEYETGWSGRYYSTKEELVTLGAYPVAAYRVNDWLSVGGGAQIAYGLLTARLRSATFSAARTGRSSWTATMSASAASPACRWRVPASAKSQPTSVADRALAWF